MKLLLLFTFFFSLLAGCQSQPAYTDNGNPGQIKAVAFYDDNRNGIMDNGETGASVQIAFTQNLSCAEENPTRLATDANGISIFQDLMPGKYCVFPWGNYGMTTKLTQDVYVSSDVITTVAFGISRE